MSIKNANGVDITNTGNFAIVNPFRYRGYYYDTESGLYYLQSRYYDPTTGRFVNADAIAYSTTDNTVGLNLFAYSDNNFVSKMDIDGSFAITITLLAVVGITVVTAYTAYTVFSIINSPSFRESWNRMCNRVGSIICEGLSSIGGSIRSSARWLSNTAGKIWEALNFRLSGIPNYRSPTELHHIVAQMAKNAQYARVILSNTHIGINSTDNLVRIKTGLHRRLHTNAYYGWANSVVISAYNSAGNNRSKQRSNVLNALLTIRGAILYMNRFAPF